MKQKEKPILVFNDYVAKGGPLARHEKARKEIELFDEYCPFCKLKCWKKKEEIISEKYIQEIAVCLECGWWSWHDYTDTFYCSASAIMKKFSVESDSVPCRELSNYVEKNPEKLLKISPKKFEELVASIYSNVFGYRVEFCSYCRPDKGIDVICIRSNDKNTIALQAKRYKNPIKLGQIHQFFGALFDAEYKSGVFVTSGLFQRGCYDTVNSLEVKSGIEIDLVNGEKFLDWLGLLNKQEREVDCFFWGRKALSSGKKVNKLEVPWNKK